MTALTAEQERAVARRDRSLIVRAGAGTGKTTVLVERFVRAVVEDGAAVEAMLAITFTEKASAEMKTRVRKRFVELGRRADARAAEGAWISTIHGFCARVLRAHALSAGIDPDFRVLDELEAQRIRADAFDAALEEFMGTDPERLELVAAYTADQVSEMVRTAYSRLRSQGQRQPRLEPLPVPPPAQPPARLEAAARAAFAELSGGNGVSVERAIGKLERTLALVERIPAGELADPADLRDLSIGGNAKALCTDTCVEYGDALGAYASLCGAHREYRDHGLLRALLELYGERYERGKRARSALDFEDLELLTRDLLRDHEGLRHQYAERFEHVLVDEFQDTNPLQNELLELLERDNLFRVGDENQSIYGFRHADVEVFRGHWERAAADGRAESITVNFRSRAEVLEAIDRCFAGVWPERFEALQPGREPQPARVTPSVELLVTDLSKKRWDEALGTDDPFGAAMHAATPWRAAEARLLAKRVDELRAEGGWEWRDIVLLFRATTHMGFYERALAERGIDTHVVGGRGYWEQQQVADLRQWLAALANPLDELAVYSVLASPLAGLSLDAVALIGLLRRDSGRDPWWLLRESQDELAELLPAADARRAAAFAELFAAERRAATQVSLETLIDRAVTSTGYDRHVLSLPAGTRRMANVRKLMRMAREYEAEEGRDLRGFIDTVAERDAALPREGEAPLEAEALDAVRLMTIHRAKGLEFPVVCVADLGKDGRDDDGALRISDDGMVGLRLASLGGGKPLDSERLTQIKARQREVAEEEERRVFYVAATRAQEHLVLSGATDLDKRPEPDLLKEPMRWLMRGFAGPGARVTELTPANAAELLPQADRVPAPPEPAPVGGDVQPELGLGTLPAPRALPVSRLSYSSLEDYRRCSYRFYLQRALRLAPVERPFALAPEEPAEPGLGPLLRGTLVHELLERLDFARPAVPGEEDVGALIESHGAEVRPDEVADLRAMVERFAGSDLCARLARAQRVRSELPFAFTLDPPGAGGRSVLVNGVVDVHAAEPDGLLVVDYKSDALDGRDPAELTAADYSTQRLVYALAGLRAGYPRVEVVHCFLERPDTPASETFEAADAAPLEEELLRLAGGVVEGRFEPTAEAHWELCSDCPGRAALCSWDEQRTLQRL
ncbi:MAG TPA: UvrD-helicase domain-containing protein [Thermoleophilaceae bacterium]|nr:UvrD-helicase domain-containing protein [Thermoleophilaceae bacterium]